MRARRAAPATPKPPLRDLRALAGLCGIQGSYVGQDGRRHTASAESLLGALRAYGVPVERPDDAMEELRAARLARWTTPIEPVTVAWDGELPEIELRLPARSAGRKIACRVELEGGGATPPVASTVAAGRAEDVEGRRFVANRIVPGRHDPLPFGYHRLCVRGSGVEASSLLISAPSSLPKDARARGWGVFLPLYALHSSRSWGVGDLTDLSDLVEWVAGLGGEVVATLPILASFLDRPFEPSPYAPASRLFWNELFLDVAAVPELERSTEAQQALESQHVRNGIEKLRGSELVDYRMAMALKHRLLEPMARSVFEDGGRRREAFESHLRTHPELLDYATYRAAVERLGETWERWPQAEREGILPSEGGNPEAFRYHCYVQWLMADQLAGVDRRARDAGASLYFDVPLGVHRGGYDVWRERDAFALAASAGAPPDLFFTGGQNWAFPPLHPEAIRNQGYRYPIACLRHVLRRAGVVRLDHVMGLHRLFWIPQGMGPGDGVYVRYRPGELYAIVLLEASRAGAMVVGEDLGVVPNSVRRAMARHGLHRSHVLPWELTGDPARPVRPPPRRSFAGLNTHDIPPFAAWWERTDPRTRRALTAFLRRRGRLDRGGGRAGPDAGEALAALLDELAASPAREVMVNLEDLWLETRPQNVPGTTDAYPNWRRKARHSLEELRGMPRVVDTLRRIDAARTGTSPS